MPLGFERLNERSQRPNALINFIKPIDGPDRALAEDFLNRIAAQCYPIMKAAHISVMSLEEFPANREFLGRNFNAGECIQLVLKDRKGQWLGFKFVQMVMMHELAHCSQMNHSKYFWQVRNKYAGEMEGLWSKQYLGEGLWGRGQALSHGGFVLDRELEHGDVPEHLCGGSYRRRGRKRKRGTDGTQQSTYAERQQRRIAKKFGKHGEGNELGEDELVRGALEQGRRQQGKPRVANSKRGRDLRAQAALARFGAAKEEQRRAEENASTLASDDDDDLEWSESEPDTEHVRHDGEEFVKICAEEDDDEDAHHELEELRAISDAKKATTKATEKKASCRRITSAISGATSDTSDTESELESSETLQTRIEHAPTRDSIRPNKRSSAAMLSEPTVVDTALLAAGHETTVLQPRTRSRISTCGVCSLENDAQALLCLACANVLRPKLVRDSWRCQSVSCMSAAYLNAGDNGRCGICGQPKPIKMPQSIGLVTADVLRWD